MKARKSLLHNGEEFHNFLIAQTLDALNSRFTINT